jgi:hypothetical protein
MSKYERILLKAVTQVYPLDLSRIVIGYIIENVMVRYAELHQDLGYPVFECRECHRHLCLELSTHQHFCCSHPMTLIKFTNSYGRGYCRLHQSIGPISYFRLSAKVNLAMHESKIPKSKIPEEYQVDSCIKCATLDYCTNITPASNGLKLCNADVRCIGCRDKICDCTFNGYAICNVCIHHLHLGRSIDTSIYTSPMISATQSTHSTSSTHSTHTMFTTLSTSTMTARPK